MANKEKKQVNKVKTLEAGSYNVSEVKTTPIDLPYDEIVEAVKKGKAYVLQPEFKQGVVLRGVKKLQEKFNMKVKVEKITDGQQFVVLPE